MIQLISLTLFLFSFQTMLPMDKTDDEELEQVLAQDEKKQTPVTQYSQLQQSPTNQTLEKHQSLAALLSRSLQYQLGINDIEWTILHGEQVEGATIVATYFDHIKNGTTDPVIISKYDKRKTIANNIAEKLTRKLAIFCSNYNLAEKKVPFLTKHNQEWEQITQIDIDRARFLVNEYPHRLLAPEIVTALKDRIEKIQAIINSIENSDKK